jgi:hypothetical protein
MAKEEKDKISDKEVQCDYCPSKLGFLYTVETTEALQIVATCHRCRSTKVPEHKVYGFMRWLWPKDASVLRQELLEAKKGL